MRRRALRRRYGHTGGADRARLSERRKVLSYNDKVRDEQRFGTKLREELKAMFFSGGNVGVGMPRMISESQAGDMAADFYRAHVSEADALYRQGYGASDAARALGNQYKVRHFR